MPGGQHKFINPHAQKICINCSNYIGRPQHNSNMSRPRAPYGIQRMRPHGF